MIEEAAVADAAATEPAAVAPTKPEAGTAEPKTSKWEAMLGEIGKDSEALAEPTDEGEEGQDDAEEGAEPKATKPAVEAEPKGDAAKEKPAEPTKAAVPFQIVDGKGTELAVEWPEGTKVVFKADGKAREVTSMGDLVVLAQKGVAFDRKSSEFGQHEARFRQVEATLNTSVGSLREQLAQAEETILLAVFDDDVREKMAEELAEYRDPNARRAMKAEAKLTEKEQAEATATERQAVEVRVQALDQFRAKVGERINAQLTDYPNLDADDFDLVVTEYGKLYDAERDRIYQHLVGQAVTPDRAEAEADRLAFRVFTEDALDGVMKRLDEKFGKKVGPKKAKVEADAHNRKVTEKITQRDASRAAAPLGDGAPPRAAPAAPALDPTAKKDAFSQFRARMRSALQEESES